MMIAYADPRTHEPPTGWEFLTDQPEDMPEYDAECWYLERVW